MFRIILLSALLVFQSQFLYAQLGEREDQSIEPRSTAQRFFEVERSLGNLQRQIERLSANLDQNKREFRSMSQTVNSLKRSVDSMESKISDLKSEQRDLSRRLNS